jgi:ABC-2 type transport system ATP-binding protein
MIHVERLTKYFGHVLAVDDVTFQVEKNEIVGLLGNNGAGKTTIMRILTTYLPASRGVARVAGYDIMNDSLEVRKRVGYLPESIPLYTEMRVEEYLDYRAKLKGVDRRQRPQRIAYCLERCRVQGVRRSLLGTLSKGFRQRVGLADAMIADPPLLILDEPTDGLDPGQKQDALAMLKELGRDHTILLSSHMLTEVESIAQRVLIIRSGRLVLARKLDEMEADRVVVVEVRGPADQVARALRGAAGVAAVSQRGADDGVTAFEVRPQEGHDPREAIFAAAAANGWALRRLDLRRRGLQERWNEINNLDDAALRRSPATVEPAANRVGSTAVSQ